jgi:DNA repair protein RecN (Recombination protein N)
LKKNYFKYAKELSNMRRQESHKLREKLIAITKNLNMEQLDLKIDIVTTELITPKGIDIVQILIKTNPEQNFESIDKIASGGEISRIMLALKLVSSSHYDNKTIIFDEIDSGTGGKTAKMIGINLKELSKNMQVILITHQPQIAAISDNIFKVTKEFEFNKTVLNARYLQEHEVESEISYMISGDTYDKKAKNTTQTLLLKT